MCNNRNLYPYYPQAEPKIKSGIDLFHFLLYLADARLTLQVEVVYTRADITLLETSGWMDVIIIARASTDRPASIDVSPGGNMF